jgi:pilus assembly protein Flp/PilA
LLMYRTEQAQGLVEYAIILLLVALVVIGVLTLMGPGVGNMFSKVNDLFP